VLSTHKTGFHWISLHTKGKLTKTKPFSLKKVRPSILCWFGWLVGCLKMGGSIDRTISLLPMTMADGHFRNEPRWSIEDVPFFYVRNSRTVEMRGALHRDSVVIYALQ
jgi:hypothetical protein